jgi:hypothetical protein
MERFLKRRLPEESSTPNPQPQALDEGERIKLGDLSIKLVETRRHIAYPLEYLLLELSLILPVATATAERAFSAMNIVKNRM